MNDTLSIQQLVNEVKQLTEPLDRAGLQQLVLQLAQRRPVVERAAFLGELKAALAGPEPAEKKRAAVEASDDAALARIKSIFEEAVERQGLIENGEYHELEEWDDRNWNDYDDDCPDALTEDHRDELKGIREEADHAWLDGDAARAVGLYRALIELSGDAWEESIDLSDICDLSLGESYCRAICLLSAEEERASVLYDALVFTACCLNPDRSWGPDGGAIPLQRLGDLLSDREPMRHLLEREESPLAKRWYVELLLIDERHEDAWAWIRQNGKEHPMALACYLNALEEASDWARLAEGARFALETGCSKRNSRTAEQLIRAGRALDRPTDVAFGLRAAFEEHPEIAKIIRLHELLEDRDLIVSELGAYRRFLQDKPFGRCLALVMVLLGDFEALVQFCSSDPKYVGWSFDSAYPIAVGAGFALLCRDRPDLPSNVQCFLERSLYPRAFDIFAREKADSAAFLSVFRKALNEEPDVELESFVWDWLRKTVVKRAEHIVKNQHRGAYDRAAEGIAAWAECARAHGRSQDADAIVAELLGKFPRHSAFKQELNKRR